MNVRDWVPLFSWLPTYRREWLRSPLGATLGRERMFFNVEMAVAKYLADRGENKRIQS